MTAKILQKLRVLDFPECSKQAINYLVSCFTTTDHGSLPGLSGAPENLAQEVSKDFILFSFQNQRGKRVYFNKYFKKSYLVMQTKVHLYLANTTKC